MRNVQQVTWPRSAPIKGAFILAKKCLGGDVRVVSAVGLRGGQVLRYYFRRVDTQPHHSHNRRIGYCLTLPQTAPPW